MAFGMNSPAAGDVPDIVKYHAPSGRLFCIDYDPNNRTKTPIDITTPAPKFAIDFGSMQLGFVYFPPASAPEYRTVPEGQPLPAKPSDKDADGKPKFKPVVRLKLYGKVLNGLRDFSPTANVVHEALEDLYFKYRDASEAQSGKIPVVELTKTIPIQMGKPPRQSINYMPCFAIVGWTDRIPEMGPRTTTIPLGAPRTSAPPATALREFELAGVTSNKPLPGTGGGALVDDEIPFGACWQ